MMATTHKNSSPLSERVYKELSKIPKGTVITYKELAKRCGTPNTVRHIATIVGKNPNPITVPCHRVIRSDGAIGEYTFKGKRNPAKKIALLKSEGVKISGNKVVEK